MISLNDAFAWLNEFEPSKLIWPDNILRDVIRQKITVERYSEACRIIEYFISYKNTIEIEKPFEKGEICIECAVAYNDMGYQSNAVKSLKMAEKEYSVAAASHRYAVARWMLGTVQWNFEKENAGALVNWKGAIKDFYDLKMLAKSMGKISDERWYRVRIVEMEKSLEEKILEKFA